MSKFITHPDGRLKTGRLSLILFGALLLGLSLLFYLQKPVDRAVVVVKHVFTASRPAAVKPLKEQTQKAEKKAPPKAPPKASQPAAVKNLQTAEKKPARAVAPAPAPPVPAHERVKVVKQVPALKAPAAPPEKVAVKRTGSEARNEATASKPVKTEPENQAQALAAADRPVGQTPAAGLPVKSEVAPAPAKTPARNETGPADKIVSEEVVVDLQRSWSAPAAKKPGAARLISAADLGNLRKHYAGAKPAPAVKEAARPFGKIRFTRPESRVAAAPTPAPKAMPRRSKAAVEIAVKLPGLTPPVAQKAQPPAITVARKEYYKLNRAWRKAGEGKEKNDALIPLRIENLRSAYGFLQMKPVLIRVDGSCIDLTDGRRLPPQFLDRFSATVIAVNDPWQKWGRELRRAGLRPGDKFKVRYYLYDFVRRSVYARVNQAYEWARKEGLLPASTRPADVDVLGRAYVVKRDGGGAFGVFVPLELTSRNGRTIKIDPVAFNRAPEIIALRQAGLI